MLGLIVYIAALLLELAFLVGFTFYIISLIYSSVKGSPYVPTKRKQVEMILKEAHLKKGDYLIEIGSGDGRFAITASRKYGVKGLGIDINPLLTHYAALQARRAGVKNVKFKTANILHEDLSSADVVYIFLMPALIKSLQPVLTKLKKNTLVISHGFRVPYLQKKNIKTIESSPFPTYFYKI